MTFAQVKAKVAEAPGLTDGMRSNILGAVSRVAMIMSPVAGEATLVNIPAISKKLDKLTPARLGFKTKNALAVMKSNLRRGLDIAGFKVMPGRFATKLTPAWSELLSRLDEKPARHLTRLAHVATDQGWSPEEITDGHIERFRQLVENTCLKSKSTKTVRSTIKAWNAAVPTISGWPQTQLDTGRSDAWYYGKAWSDFAPTFREDVEAFLDRGEESGDFLDVKEGLDPLSPRTKDNYRGGYLRAASILVALEAPIESISNLASLVAPKRAKSIIYFLRERLKRETGGQVGFIAMLLYIAARDWVYRDEKTDLALETVGTLEMYFKKTKQKNNGMSDRTRERLIQFDDRRVLDEYLNAPTTLMARAKSMPINADSARLVRLALFVALDLDTLFRVGNVVALDLYDHFQANGKGKKRKLFVVIPDTKVKNKVDLHCPLRPRTIEIFDEYIQYYRRFNGPETAPWLFPAPSGQHWSDRDARLALKDYCDKELGIDMTPHVNRSLGGKIILDEKGTLLDVKENLGHKRLTTSISYYVSQNQDAVRAKYHAILDRREKGAEREYP